MKADGTFLGLKYQGPAIRETVGRPGRSEEVAAVAAWLLSDYSSYRTGAIIAVGRGYWASLLGRKPPVGDFPGQENGEVSVLPTDLGGSCMETIPFRRPPTASGPREA